MRGLRSNWFCRAGAALAPLKTIISIGTDTNTAPSNTTVKYTPPCGGGSINGMWQSAASLPATPCPVAGTLSNLYFRCPAALTGAQSWTCTLVVNGVDTALTATVTSAGLFAVDNAHSVHVNAGDTICFKSAPSGIPTAQTIVQIGCLFTADAGQNGPMFSSWVGSAAGTGYGTPGNINSSAQAESSRRAIMPTAGTITTLLVSTNTAPGAGNSRSVTLMKNGIDVLTATIADANTSASAAGNVSFAPGDLIQLRKDASATAASGLTLAGIDWRPAFAGEMLLLSPSTGNFDSATTLFQNLQGTAENSEINEANALNPIPVAATLTKWRADLQTAPGNGKSRTFTVRKNSADTAAAIAVADLITSASIAPNLALAAGDLVAWKEVPTGAPAASNPVATGGVLVVT